MKFELLVVKWLKSCGGWKAEQSHPCFHMTAVVTVIGCAQKEQSLDRVEEVLLAEVLLAVE